MPALKKMPQPFRLGLKVDYLPLRANSKTKEVWPARWAGVEARLLPHSCHSTEEMTLRTKCRCVPGVQG